MARDPVLYYRQSGEPVYRSGCAPAYLGTRRQLRAEGLSVAGLEPAAWLRYCAYHYECPLYDRRRARPVRPLTERQRAALAAGRKLANTVVCGGCGTRIAWYPGWSQRCDSCYWEAVHAREARRAAEHEQMLAAEADRARRWAAGVLADPGVRILDTETTGLENGYAVQLAVLTVAGEVLVDTLLNPQVPIPSAASAIHGITDAMVSGAPAFGALVDRLAAALHGRRLVIYNAAFDLGVLRRELDRHYRQVEPVAGLPEWETHPAAERWLARLGPVECAMEMYAQWYGQWHDYWQDFTWQPLGGGHDARGDCETVIERLREMAGTDAPHGPVRGQTETVLTTVKGTS